MTPSGFQVFADPNGNLWVADGWVSQLRSGVRLPIGSGSDFSECLPPSWDAFRQAQATEGGTFVGGSGRNLVLTGLTAGPSGPALPIGLFTPGRPNLYDRGIFTLTVTGSSAAAIHDGTNTVAELSAGGTAPVGNYVATSYGRTTYNGGTAFTLAAAAEEGAPGVFPTYLAVQSAAVAQDGSVIASDAANYYFDNDSDWTIEVAADGSAEILYLGTAYLLRAAGSASDPAGYYQANAAGMAAYNSGDPWSIFIQAVPAAPRAGFAYVTLTEAGGVLSAASGPYLATALPADTATEFHVPIAQSDGIGGLVQLHTGLLIWSGLPVAGEMASEYVEMTTPRTTTSATLEDITGAAASITLPVAGKIAVFMNCEVSSDGICSLGLAISIDGTDHDETTIHLSGSADSGAASIIHRSATLAAGTYAIKGRFRRVSGSPKIPGVDRVDLMVVSLQGAMGAAGSDGATGPMGDPDKTSRNLFILGL